MVNSCLLYQVFYLIRERRDENDDSYEIQMKKNCINQICKLYFSCYPIWTNFFIGQSTSFSNSHLCPFVISCLAVQLLNWRKKVLKMNSPIFSTDLNFTSFWIKLTKFLFFHFNWHSKLQACIISNWCELKGEQTKCFNYYCVFVNFS